MNEQLPVRFLLARAVLPLLGWILMISSVESFAFAPRAGSRLSRPSSLMAEKGTAVIAGATGYIGKAVVRESVRQGYRTIALVRDTSKVESAQGQALYKDFMEGAEVVECDVTQPEQLTAVSIAGDCTSGGWMAWFSRSL